MRQHGLSGLKNLSFLHLRHKAEAEAAGLPGLIAAAEKAAHSVLSGEHRQRKSGTGEKFWQYREYDVSDRPQDIDWRQSGKGDRLFVREMEWQTTQTALIWSQNDAGMDYRSADTLPTKKETALVLSLALGILLSRAGEQIAALEGTGIPGRSGIALEKVAEDLTQNGRGAVPDTGIRKVPARCSLILVGDFLAPLDVLTRTFDVLADAAENAVLIQVLDPAELTLPFSGRTIFTAPGGHDKFPVDHVETVRAAYRGKIEAHMESLKDYCRKHRWQWLLHSTDEAVRDTLFDAWMMMAPESVHAGGER